MLQLVCVVFLLCFSTLNSIELPAVGQPLNNLCVDNIRTQSWWTYSICFNRSVMQVHVDSRSKQLQEKVHLGEFVAEQSSEQRQVYRTSEPAHKSCLSTDKSGAEVLHHRTSVVQLKCCEDIVHLRRQSRHTRLSTDGVTEKESSLSHYWGPELAATQAAEELQASRNKRASNPADEAEKPGVSGGYSAAASTATSMAYIHSVEEPSPCNYEIHICSDLVCNKPTQKGSAGVQSSKAKEASAVIKEKDEGKEKTTSTSASNPVKSTTQNKRTPATVSTNRGSSSQSASAKTPAAADSVSPVVPPVPVAAVSTSAVTTSPLYVTSAEQRDLKERSKQMFYHAYDSYMHNAFPEAELLPISCTGGKFDLIKIPLVTLIDTLDTLVILGNHSEFRRAVNIISTDLPDFNLDANVSVFETTIRVLGGLLSAHLMAIDPKLNIYGEHTTPYDGRLLSLSLDLGERLLPAFETRTSIPYGTVNLRYGVPRGETKIASTAGAGSLLLEFQVLSHLTGQHRFGEAAYLAMRGLYDRKSPLGLLGKHIHTETGQWSEALSGVGSNADSFYEYLLKAYLLFRDKELYGMFSDTYRAIKQFVMPNEHWFTEVDMFSGKLQRKRLENLDAFWPGVEAMLGFSHHGAGQLNTFFSIWQDLGFLPEEIDYFQWQIGKGAANGLYPLRPELIESTYHQYRTTGDRSWLSAGKVFLESIEQYTRTDCGYASVLDVSTLKLADSMPSFFLSETCKYLYLLFDEDNFVNHRPYIFSTEAHPFDALQVHFGDLRGTSTAAEEETDSAEEDGRSNKSDGEVSVSEEQEASESNNAKALIAAESSALVPIETETVGTQQEQKKGRRSSKKNKLSKTSLASPTTVLDEVRRHHQMLLEGLKSGSLLKVLSPDQTNALSKQIQLNQNLDQAQIQEQLQRMFALPPVAVSSPSAEPPQHYLPMKCRKPQWWDKSTSYDAEYLQAQNSQLRKEAVREKAPFRRKQRSSAVRQSSTLSRTAVNGEGPLRVRERLGPQGIAHFTFLLLDLAQQVHNWENSAQRVPFPQLSKLKWFERPSPLFRQERCLPDEQPSKKGHKKDPNAPPAGSSPGTSPKSQNGAEPIKSVRIEMPALGMFSIHVYTDGFLIHNELDDTLVEISNIGRTLVLLRENTQSSSKSDVDSKILMANVDNYSVNSCRVQVVQTSENFHSLRTLFDRPCSVANFGPTLSSEGASISTESVIYDPANLLCAPPKASATAANKQLPAPTAEVSSTGNGEESGKEPPLPSSPPSPPSTSPGSSNSNSKWWQWSLLQFLSGEVAGAPSSSAGFSGIGNKGGNGNADGGKLALVDRGDCLFEDKANNAVLLGAQGLVVRNSEDTVFIMAGKRDVEAETGTPSSSPDTTSTTEFAASAGATASPTSRLPVTVMLTKTDGLAFEQAVRDTLTPPTEAEQGSGSYGYSYNIAASMENMLLRSDLMGDFTYPKLFMHRKSIFVMGSGRWATLLLASQGKTEDWQLYLMSKEDVYSTHIALVPPNQVLSKHGQRKSMPHTILQDPAALYLHTYARKCPGVVKVATNNMAFLT